MSPFTIDSCISCRLLVAARDSPEQPTHLPTSSDCPKIESKIWASEAQRHYVFLAKSTAGRTTIDALANGTEKPFLYFHIEHYITGQCRQKEASGRVCLSVSKGITLCRSVESWHKKEDSSRAIIWEHS